jgi:DNA-directed RNA polymerase subunit F
MEIKDERFVTMAEARKLLKEKEKIKELGYEQKNALEFLNKFSKLSLKDAKQMFEELKQIQKLKDKHIVSIIDLLPKDNEDLRVIFANEIISLSEDEKKKILETVKKYAT